ncbi:basic amino acid ABC transporter substrate-binding protein [Bacillus luteolus]|uniref:Basic amino acid ABC transporter substrate-binding protein n=1 Tax=Litchfieldia luteola TaxID=682179 RepID=A0ABR9QPI5_9BACI|nr:basic amino acid ABC transporter substrate-binding protein [Cytobacillus luteolus]MBE4910421.1 basic amino acid ABC transporter substrate-binding protein [Cytobacillus luteolus]MBP1942003.1 polar amino acid transport system substrate-binding protein [Cytobacillus luteolus]
MKKKNAILLLITSLIVGLLAACGSGASTSGDGEGKKVLVMGTSADFPPFETLDTNGEIVGFDIDLAKHIANELGYEIEIKDMSFDGLIGALQTKRIDFVASGMSATEKRKESVDFSIEYHRSGEMFVSLKDSGINSIEDLDGKKIGVQLGTIQEEGANKIAEQMELEVKTLNKVPDLIQELKSKRVDAVYLDKTVAEGYIKELDLAGFNDPNESTPGMAIAFPKGSEITESFNKVIKEMQENGELEKLEKKWLETE